MFPSTSRKRKPPTILPNTEENNPPALKKIKVESDKNDHTPEMNDGVEKPASMKSVVPIHQDIHKAIRDNRRNNQCDVPNYLLIQVFIYSQYRSRVINWLINAQQLFQYHMPSVNFFGNDVLHHSIKLYDIFLCRIKYKLRRDELQLLAGTAVFLASKFLASFSEIFFYYFSFHSFQPTDKPLLDDIVYMCEDKYTEDQFIKMEILLFKTLGYNLGIPFPYRFLNRFAIGVNLERRTLMLARYILETSLMFYPFIGEKDDLLAASSLLLALRMKGMNDWNENLIEVTGYTEEEVEPIMKCLNHMMIKRHRDYEDLDAAHEKYSKDLYLNVAQKPAFLEDDFDLTDPIGPPQSKFTSFRMPFPFSSPEPIILPFPPFVFYQ